MLQSTPAHRGSSVNLTIPASPQPHERRVLSEIELAQRWGVSPKTLQRWRSEGRGPHYLKLSKRVTYPLETVTEYEHSALHVSTSERVIK
ncbi:MAG: helix-turn-helix domain-containing protein [Burkholderiaceae bacterium]